MVDPCLVLECDNPSIVLYDPENSFTCGVTIVEFVAVTKVQGNITDYGDGAPRKFQRYVLPERFAMHHDSNYLSWRLEKKWKDRTPWIWPKSFVMVLANPENVEKHYLIGLRIIIF